MLPLYRKNGGNWNKGSDYIMKEVYRTTNPSEIALLKSVFESAGITPFVFDEQMNSMALYGAWAACRFMVVDEEYDDACKILKECNLEPSHD